MEGLIENKVWKQVPGPEGKQVVETKMLYKRKTGANGEVEKYKCRFVATGFQQIEELHYQENISPTPSAASIKKTLATAAVDDRS